MRDYSEDELKKIDRFLDNNGKFGKNVMYVADTSQPESLPNLDAFLAEWGIKVNPGAVYETDSSKVFNYQRYFVITDYAEDTYSESSNLQIVWLHCQAAVRWKCCLRQETAEEQPHCFNLAQQRELLLQMREVISILKRM